MKIEKKTIDKNVFQYIIIDCSDYEIEIIEEWLNNNMDLKDYNIGHFSRNVSTPTLLRSNIPNQISIVTLYFYDIKNAIAFQLRFC